jgi:hypothetical protein
MIQNLSASTARITCVSCTGVCNRTENDNLERREGKSGQCDDENKEESKTHTYPVKVVRDQSKASPPAGRRQCKMTL